MYVYTYMDPLTPCTWRTLQEYHNSIVDIIIPRLPNVLQAYIDYKETDEYKNFGLQTLYNKARTRMDASILSLFDELQKMNLPYFIILRNDFPYHLEEGIHHYVAWYVHPEIVPDSIPELAVFALYRYLGAVLGTVERSYCAFQNSIQAQSISHIPHIHVFTNGLRLQECAIPC